MMLLVYKHIIRQFASTLAFFLLALSVINIVVNLLENLDNFLDSSATPFIIAEYYIVSLPAFLKILMPIAVLLSSLFTAGKMAQNNEIVAVKAGGGSLYAMILPILLAGLALSFGQLYFNSEVVPASVELKLSIERDYLRKGGETTTLYNVYLRDLPTRNVLIQYYDNKTKEGNKITIEEFSTELHPLITRRISSSTFMWDTTARQWIFMNGIEYEFDTANAAFAKATPFTRRTIALQTTPEQIMSLQRSTEEMTFSERREYIDLSERGGKDVSRERIAFAAEYALPFANFIVILFGVPFSSNKRKSGFAVEIAAAMVVTFAYLVLTTIGQAIGHALKADPTLTAWFANIVFLVLGTVNIIRMKT